MICINHSNELSYDVFKVKIIEGETGNFARIDYGDNCELNFNHLTYYKISMEADGEGHGGSMLMK